ncbi:MAG TPA: hypothetical protein VMU01_03810 [Rhizomicrobium sp.]|nr:hypothetical protein [Rhizomicrobium sp.]
MSIMSGLVGHEAEGLAPSRRDVFGEWAMRNAWGLILAGSLGFWIVLGGILIFG